MPLDGTDGQAVVGSKLDDAVIALLQDGESCCEASDGLVVIAVGDNAAAVELLEEGPRAYGGQVVMAHGLPILVVVPGVMAVLGLWKVLDQVSAEGNVDDLCAPADPEDRLFLLCIVLRQRDLCVIQCPVHVPGAVPRLSEQGGIDVIPAGKKEGVALRQALRLPVLP